MATAIAGISGVKSGLCPHGLPPGACPICSGMGGGGSAVKKADFSAKPGEMSWNECAAIGAFLKAQQMAKQQAQQTIQNNLIALANFQKTMNNLANQIATFSSKLANLPPAIAKPLTFVANKILLPLINVLKNIPTNSLKFMNKLIDISDKLTAMFGELKNATEKKISEKLKAFKKKLRSLFEVFEPSDIDDQEKKIEEEKRIFELKTFINKLYEKLNQDNKENIYESD